MKVEAEKHASLTDGAPLWFWVVKDGKEVKAASGLGFETLEECRKNATLTRMALNGDQFGVANAQFIFANESELARGAK